MQKYYSKISALIKGFILRNSVYCYYGQFLNFGDQLTPIILRYYHFTPIYSHYIPSIPFIPKANFVSTGTLLQNTPSSFNGIVLGTGADNVRINLPNATILAVRGKLTRNNLSITGREKIPLGDPGLLMNRIYPIEVQKKYKLGIIPHFVDLNQPCIKIWQRSLKENITIISPQASPEVVIRKIKECNCILSSSLHGIIIADAFHIPAGRFVCRNTMPVIDTKRHILHDHKYNDYYSSLNEHPEVLENPTGHESLNELLSITRVAPNTVKELQKQLHELFLSLKNFF